MAQTISNGMKKRLNFDLILLGDPTSGKDTQAGILTKYYALRSVESGKHWRAMAKKNNAQGRWLRRTMSLGHPTPVVLMKKFLRDQLKNVPKNKDLIFVGNPRLKPEAMLLKKLLDEKHRDFFVIYLRLPEKEILKRTSLRQRLFSEDKGVSNRIRYHKEQVSKTVAYFKGLGKLKTVNGDQSIKSVSADIQKIIHDY